MIVIGQNKTGYPPLYNNVGSEDRQNLCEPPSKLFWIWDVVLKSGCPNSHDANQKLFDNFQRTKRLLFQTDTNKCSFKMTLGLIVLRLDESR